SGLVSAVRATKGNSGSQIAIDARARTAGASGNGVDLACELRSVIGGPNYADRLRDRKRDGRLIVADQADKDVVAAVDEHVVGTIQSRAGSHGAVRGDACGRSRRADPVARSGEGINVAGRKSTKSRSRHSDADGVVA